MGDPLHIEHVNETTDFFGFCLTRFFGFRISGWPGQLFSQGF